jgi:hypothetical protein
MVDNKMRVKIYEMDVKFLEGLEDSAFEMLDTLHIRDRLFEEFDRLETSERELVRECDQILLDHVAEFMQHIGQIHDWSTSKKQYNQWWWHLDKIDSGDLLVDLRNGSVKYESES